MKADDLDLETIVQHYLIAALWSSSGHDDCENLDDKYGIGDCSEQVNKQAEIDCRSFIKKTKHILIFADTNNEQIGHDFWLTRNGHGVGFWDRDYASKYTIDKLTGIAESFGEIDLYVGDDGKIYS